MSTEKELGASEPDMKLDPGESLSDDVCGCRLHYGAEPRPVTFWRCPLHAAAPETAAERDRLRAELEIERQLGLECNQMVQNFIKDDAPPGILASGSKVMLGQHDAVRTGKMNAFPDPERVCALSGPSKSCADRDRLREVNAELAAALEDMLGLCRSEITWCDSAECKGCSGITGQIESARAALAKAKDQT